MATEQVLQYIRTQRAAGHSDAQIRAAMVANGYTSAMVDEAFRSLNPSTSSSPLTEVVSQYLATGMTPSQISETLISQGYPSGDVKRALHHSISEPSHHKGIMITFLFLAAMVAGGFLVLMFQQYSPGSSNPSGAVAQTTPQMIISNILAQSKGLGKEESVRQCKQLLFGDDRDNCIMGIATSSDFQDDTLCDQVQDAKLHDLCLIAFFNTPKFDSACSRMKLAQNQQMCSNINAEKTK